MENNIKLGDKVQLITGSVIMVIGEITQGEATCYYYDGNSHTIISVDIPLAALKISS
jgi:uncharacterized protein YodC (DUF2158 family)